MVLPIQNYTKPPKIMVLPIKNHHNPPMINHHHAFTTVAPQAARDGDTRAPYGRAVFPRGSPWFVTRNGCNVGVKP